MFIPDRHLLVLTLLEDIPPGMQHSWDPAANGQDNAQAHVQAALKVPVATASVHGHHEGRTKNGQDRQEDIAAGANILIAASFSVRHVVPRI